MDPRRPVSSAGFLEFCSSHREHPSNCHEPPPGWPTVVTPTQRREPQFVVDDMMIQVPPIQSVMSAEPPVPLMARLDFGFSYTQDRRILDPRKSRSLPSSFKGSPPRPASDATHETHTVATDCAEGALGAHTPASSPRGRPSLFAGPPSFWTQANLIVDNMRPAFEKNVGRLPSPVQPLPIAPENSIVLRTSLPDSSTKSWAAVVGGPSPARTNGATAAPGTSLTTTQSSLPTPLSTTVLFPSPVVPTPATVPTTVSFTVVALPTGDTTPSTSVAATPVKKLAPSSTPLSVCRTVIKTPAAVQAPSVTSNRYKKTDRLGKKQRDKLDHNRERREAQAAEAEASIANRREFRKRKKEKREAKLEARALKAALQEVEAQTVETHELVEDSGLATSTKVDGINNVADMADIGSVSEDLFVDASSESVSVPKPQDIDGSAHDDTCATIDELSLHVCESAALGKLLVVSDIQPSEEPSASPGSAEIGHLGSFLESNLAVRPQDAPPAESSKAKKKKKARKAKAKVARETTQLERILKEKATVPCTCDEDDDDVVEAHADRGSPKVAVHGSGTVSEDDTPIASATSEQAVGIGLIGLGLVFDNPTSPRSPSNLLDPSAPSPRDNIRAHNDERSKYDSIEIPQAEAGIQEHLGAAAVQPQTKTQTICAGAGMGLFLPSPTTSSPDASNPAWSEVGLVCDDVSSSRITTTSEPTESAITAPTPKSKSKKKQKKKKKASAPAVPQEGSDVGIQSPPPVAMPIAVGNGTTGVPMAHRGLDIHGGVLMERQGRGNLGRHRAPVTTPLQDAASDLAPTNVLLDSDLERLPPLPPSPTDTSPLSPQMSPPMLPQMSVTPTSGTSSENETTAPPRPPMKYPSWWYPWALLKHLRRLRINALQCVTRASNEKIRRWNFSALSPLLHLTIDDYFEPLRTQQYNEGRCDSLNTHWKTLIHAVWRFEGTFSMIEGWRQSDDVPASLRLGGLCLAPRLKDLLAIAQDDETDWARMDQRVKQNLAESAPYLSRVAETGRACR